MERLTANLHKAEAELAAIRDQLKGKTESFQNEIEERKRELAPWNDQINAKKSEIDIKRGQLSLVVEKTTSNARALEETENNVAEQQDMLKQRVGKGWVMA